jgi:hypothetical protein
MINFVIYDQQGTIVQQGSSSPAHIPVLKKTLGELKFLVVDDPLSNCDAHMVVDGRVVERAVPAEPQLDYAFTRHHNYGSLGSQLDLLYKDIQAGLFGDPAKTGQFATYILAVKQQYPKP